MNTSKDAPFDVALDEWEQLVLKHARGYRQACRIGDEVGQRRHTLGLLRALWGVGEESV